VLPFAVLAGCLAIGVLPALAADRTVAIRDSFFSPREVGVMPGDTVTWDGQGSLSHSVHFEGEASPVAPPSSDFSGSRQFDADGEYRYYCDVHGSMRGTVFVNATGTVPTPDPTASPTAGPTASPTASATPLPQGGSPPPPGAAAPTVTAFRVRAAKGRFCTRRSPRCKRPGVFLTLDLAASETVRVRGTLRRGSRRVRTVTLTGRPGRRRVRLPGRALKPGRYALTLRAGELSRVVRFRVRAL
jgi:plastocyanin